MPGFTPDKVVIDKDGVVYLLSTENNRIFRWSALTFSYIVPICFDSTDGTSAASPTQMAYSLAHQRLYLGYPSGRISYIDLTDGLNERAFANLPQSVRGLASAGNYMLAQDYNGSWKTHYVFDAYGRLTDKENWDYYSRFETGPQGCSRFKTTLKL